MIRPRGEIVVRSRTWQDFNMRLVLIIGGLALVRTAIGIHGLMTFPV
jgi:hypothetical protein